MDKARSLQANLDSAYKLVASSLGSSSMHTQLLRVVTFELSGNMHKGSKFNTRNNYMYMHVEGGPGLIITC